MKKKFTLLMASMMLLGASTAQAWTDAGCCYEDICCEDQTGFYVGTFAGANFISSSNSHHHNSGYHNRRNFNTGYVVDASVGYRWCHDIRMEFEYAYRSNQGKHRWHESNNRSGSYCSKHKNFVQNAYMFNGFYDIGGCQDWCIKPFVGAGIGYANTRNAHHHNGSSHHENGSVGGNGSGRSHHHHRNNCNGGFAWQLIAGLAYPICDEIDLSLEYRFFKARERKLYNNDVGVGLKYYF